MDYASWFVQTTKEAEALLIQRFGNPNEPTTQIVSDMMNQVPKSRIVTVARRTNTVRATAAGQAEGGGFNPLLLGGYILEPDLTKVAAYSGMGGQALKVSVRERWERLDNDLKPSGMRIKKGDVTKARVETKAMFMACSDEWLKGLLPLVANANPQDGQPDAVGAVEEAMADEALPPGDDAVVEDIAPHDVEGGEVEALLLPIEQAEPNINPLPIVEDVIAPVDVIEVQSPPKPIQKPRKRRIPTLNVVQNDTLISNYDDDSTNNKNPSRVRRRLDSFDTVPCCCFSCHGRNNCFPSHELEKCERRGCLNQVRRQCNGWLLCHIHYS
jgi:hypothetical protein